MVGAESICTDLMIFPSPSVFMTQKIDPTVKIWPGFGEDEEPEKCTILFVMETACTPLSGEPTVDRISSAVLRGVSHEGRFIGRGARNQEQEGNETQELDRFGPSARRNTLILWSVGLYWLSYDIACVLRG